MKIILSALLALTVAAAPAYAEDSHGHDHDHDHESEHKDDHKDEHGHDDDHGHDDHGHEEETAEAHVHGHATLTLALDGAGGELEIEIPAIDVVGFERAATNDAEEAAIADATAKLADFGGLFMLTEAAGCAATSEVEFEVEGDHAAFHAHYELTCEATDKLKGMETMIFSAFPSLEEVDASIITETAQIAAELEAGSASVTF